MGGEPKYVDATKVVKDMEPPNGNFILGKTGGEVQKAEEVAEPKAEEPKKEEKEKKEKPKKEKAGLSPDETKELEKLKNDLIARKTQLKAEGLSGGQQNKDPQVVERVTRMNEFGMTKKDLKSDPDLLDMEKQLVEFEKRAK